MQQQRNYGIDLLRMFSMLLVVILHTEGHGGVLEAAQGHSVYWAYLPEAFAYCAVNCYALISGYVGVASRWRPANLINLWLQVAFYSVGFTALWGILMPGSVGITDLLHALMPVTYQYVDYWYFTAYFGLFFLIPLLNHLVRTMPRRQLRTMLVVLVLVFSVFPTITRHDRFYLANGYSVWWLAILYLIGGYIRQYKAWEKIRATQVLGMYVGFSLLSYVLRMGRNILTRRVEWYAKIGDRFFGAQSDWLNYISPTVLLAAVGLLLLFRNLRLPAWSVRLIRFASPLAFGVYLIHNHPLVSDALMENRFASYASLPGPLLVLAVIGTAVVIYLVCTVVDAMRSLLFRLLRVRQFADWCEKALRKVFLCCSERIFG